MLNQKGFAPMILILGAVILIGLIGGGIYYYRSLPHELASNQDFKDIQESTQLDEGSQEGVADISYPDDGTKITYSGEWKEAEFPGKYNHSINIMYPSGWEFSCCGDMGSGSGHSVDPNPSDNNFDTKPFITVFDFVLQSCPDGSNSCSMDQLQKVTPAKFISNMIKNIDNEGRGSNGLTDLKKTNEVNLSNFVGGIPVYTGLSSTLQPVEVYFLQSSKGVVAVIFQQPQIFDKTLMLEFLSRLKPS